MTPPLNTHDASGPAGAAAAEAAAAERRRAPRYNGLAFEAVIGGRAYPVLDISSLGLRLGADAEGRLPDFANGDNVVFDLASTGRRRRTLFYTFGFVVWRAPSGVGIRYHVASRYWPCFLEALDQRQGRRPG